MKTSPDSKSRLKKVMGPTVPLICPHCQHEQEVRADSVSVYCTKCHNPIEIQKVLHPKTKAVKVLEKTIPLTCPSCEHVQEIRPDSVSIFCKKCHNTIEIQEVLHPKKKTAKILEKTVPLTCPSCAHTQEVRPDSVSVFCKKCHNTIDVQKIFHPASKAEDKITDVKIISCCRCQVELTAASHAQSVLCKKCGYRNDLQDYHVKTVLSRDLETQGILEVSCGGTVLNSTSKVREAIIFGKFIGKLTARQITLKSGSVFEGGIKTDLLILESDAQCHIKKEFQAKRIVIAGVYRGNIQTSQCVEIRRTGCFIGSMAAQSLFMEEGATLMGELKISSSQEKAGHPIENCVL